MPIERSFGQEMGDRGGFLKNRRNIESVICGLFPDYFEKHLCK